MPSDERRAQKLVLQKHLLMLIDGVLYHLDPKWQHLKQAVVPEHMRGQIMEEDYCGPTVWLDTSLAIDSSTH